MSSVENIESIDIEKISTELRLWLKLKMIDKEGLNVDIGINERITLEYFYSKLIEVLIEAYLEYIDEDKKFFSVREVHQHALNYILNLIHRNIYIDMYSGNKEDYEDYSLVFPMHDYIVILDLRN